MAINNEELLDKLVRTGMILRHIDGEGPCGRKRGPHGPHGHHGGHGGPEKCHGHGPGERRGKHRHGQARVLAAIAMKEGINQKELAFLLGIRPQTLGTMLQKLEEFELVERKKSEADGRAIEVRLTDAGRTHAAEIAERHALAAADILAVLDDEEKEQLGTLLDKIGAELEKHRPRPHGRCHDRPQSDEGDSEE